MSRDAKMNGHGCEVSLDHLLAMIRRKNMIELFISSSANRYKRRRYEQTGDRPGGQRNRSPLSGDLGREVVPETQSRCNTRGLRRVGMHCGVMWTSSGALVDKGQRLFPPNTLRILNHFKQNRFLKYIDAINSF